MGWWMLLQYSARREKARVEREICATDNGGRFYDWKTDLATCGASSATSCFNQPPTPRLTLSSNNVTSGAIRMNSLLQKSYFWFRSSSMKVTKAPHGCGRWTMNRSKRTLVTTSLKRSSFTSENKYNSNELNQCVWAFGYRRCKTMELRRWCWPKKGVVNQSRMT